MKRQEKGDPCEHWSLRGLRWALGRRQEAGTRRPLYPVLPLLCDGGSNRPSWDL